MGRWRVVGALLLGTSSWSDASWVGPFYPPGTKPADYLMHYASQFGAVECDATYYRMPSRRMVEGWDRKTPEAFRIAAKVPKSIVHAGDGKQPDTARLCEPDAVGQEMAEFCSTMRLLGPKCGPLVLQFTYFNKQAFPGPEPFLERLDSFLATLPDDLRFAVEVRNSRWLTPALTEVLRRHRVALVLVDLAYMPHPADVVADLDVATTDFLYVRLIGDRKKVDALTDGGKRFDRLVLDQSERLDRLTAMLTDLMPDVPNTWIFANNHFAGYGPGTIRDLLDRLGQGAALQPPHDPSPHQGELF